MVWTFGHSQCMQLFLHLLYDCVCNCTVAPTSPPLGVANGLVSSRSIQIIWSPPPDDEINGVIQHYVVKVLVAGSQEQLQQQISSLQYTLTNLQPYCTHTIQVAAFTIELGPFSGPLTVVTLEDGMD